jgi:hypothetical protein
MKVLLITTIVPMNARFSVNGSTLKEVLQVVGRPSVGIRPALLAVQYFIA